MNKKSIYLFCLFIFLWFQLLPWGAATHETLVDKSVFKSIPLGSAAEAWLKKFNLDRGFFYKYFQSDNEQYDLMQMIAKGAVAEDNWIDPFTMRRSDNHFHNPLLAFASAGLNDIASGLSLAVWAQDGPFQEPYPEKDQSWKKVRDYYYNALLATVGNEKIAYFGSMFKGIGHQIHLVQDASVPDHVRNDTHALNGDPFGIANKKYGSFRCIEGWADWNINLIYNFSDNPIFPKTHFNHILYTTAIPISNLIDSNYYDGTNPSTSPEQGLAEYTNANFISEDTVCTDYLSPDHKHYFPFPKFSDTDADKAVNGEKAPEQITAFDNKQDYVRYIKKEKNGEPITHFLKLGYFSKLFPLILKKTLFLDDLCHKDFSSMLIPRAVGYSTALINYFFRGEIEVTLPESDGIYSFCFVPEEGFKKISVMVKNITPDNEEMKNGQVSLVLSYRLGSSTPFVPDPPVPGVERIYMKIDYVNPDPNITKIDIPRDNPIRLDFNLPESSPLPTDAVDVTLTVVFKGDLGAELTDAVAIGFKDISEPTPIDLYNNTDQVCFNSNYVNYNDPALWDAVDINPKNGKIDCLYYAEIDITRKRIGQQIKGNFVYFSFNGKPANSTNYFFKYDDGWEILPGETPYRIFVLTDVYPAEFYYSFLLRSRSLDNEECFFYYYANTVHSDIPYTNKLEWVSSPEPDNCHYEHIHTPLTYTFGFLHGIFLYYENHKVPESSTCSASSPGSSSLSSRSKTNAALATPQISSEFPIKKLE